MESLVDHPVIVFVITFVGLCVASWIGAIVRKKHLTMGAEEHNDLGVILAATLTLLGLIIGFTFSMAISRYDLRKSYEEEEANAIGTEYVRTDFLPAANATKTRELLKEYLGERIKFYQTRSAEELREVNARTSALQTEMWNEAGKPAEADHSAVLALTVAGMNDVLNRQGYTQAAWWNRIPITAWVMLWVIAICCNLLLGFYVRPEKNHWVRLTVMPVVVAVSFMLIADIESPRGGVIRVRPQNLISLQQSWK